MRAVSALAAERAAAASTAQEAVATPKAKTVQAAGLEGTDVVVVVVDLPKKSLAHSCIRSSRNHHCTSIRLGDETDRS